MPNREPYFFSLEPERHWSDIIRDDSYIVEFLYCPFDRERVFDISDLPPKNRAIQKESLFS